MMVRSTAASLMSSISKQKGKNDKFTEGFMNHMYKDSTLFAATREKSMVRIKLNKLREIEEWQE